MNTKQQSGFSLIELMISITLGLLLIAAVTSIFLSSNRNFTQDTRYARLQENGRFAMRTLVEEITMAKFWGSMSDASNIDNSTPIAAQCGIPLDMTNDFVFINSPTASAVSGMFPCVDGIAFEPGTDVFAVKRTDGREIRPPQVATMVKTMPYVISNRSTGRLRIHGSGNEDVPTGNERAYRYIARLYYVKTDANGKPGLYRQSLPAAGGVNLVEELVADGVENFQIQFGIDNNGDEAADVYTPNPTAAQLRNAQSARIWLVVRADNPITESEQGVFSDDKEYWVGEGNAPYKPTAAGFPPKDKTDADKYVRRLFHTTVMLRNIAYLAALQ